MSLVTLSGCKQLVDPLDSFSSLRMSPGVGVADHEPASILKTLLLEVPDPSLPSPVSSLVVSAT